jgi:hypothetical protein
MSEPMCRFVEGITSKEWAYVTNRVRQMKARCQNPNHPNYRQYGGRGIQFRFHCVRTCAEYILTQFPIEDIKRLQIDRVDNNKHYQKGNLRLVTMAENRANRRPNLENRVKSELIAEISTLRRQLREYKKHFGMDKDGVWLK